MVTPPVQRIVPIDVGSHGGDAAALRDAGVRVDHPAVRLPNPCCQPLPDQAEKGPVIAAPAPPLQPPVMVHVVAAAFHVGLHHLPIPPVLPVTGQVSDRIPCPTSGPVPITTRQTLLRIDRRQEPGAGCLQERIFDHRDASRPLLAVALRHVTTTNPRRPVPLLLPPLDQCLDLRLQGLGLRLPCHAIHPTGRLRMQVAPAVPPELDVQAPVQVPTSVRRVGVRLVGYPPQGGWRAGCRSDGVRRTWPVRAAACRHVLPQVRGFPTLRVLCVRRLPLGIRRAFPSTVRPHLPGSTFHTVV
ncbi:MAG TPA: hypothetical protein VGC99_12455 [Candidatus Tectomicrobia bacterium]